MKHLFLVFITFSTLIVLAGTRINKPNLTLVDKDGVEVTTKSTSVDKAMEKASFLPDGVYTLKRPDVTITVTDNALEPNQPPVAITGEDITLNEGEMVILDGSNSFDTDGTIVNYEWEQTSGPPVELIPMGDGQLAFRLLKNPITLASKN